MRCVVRPKPASSVERNLLTSRVEVPIVLRLTLTFLVTIFVGAEAVAAPVWGSWAAGGTSCNAGNVQLTEHASSLSVVFPRFGVNMPRNGLGDGLSAQRTCTFRISITPPPKSYLAGFKQIYSGGLSKSASARAELGIHYNIGSLTAQPLPVVWRKGQVIATSDPEALYTKSFYNNFPNAGCGTSTAYGIEMSLSASRGNLTSDHLVGGLDPVDADFVQKVVLIPEWASCS